MRYSIVLPYYDPKYRKTELLTACVRSVVENSRGYDYELVLVKDGSSYVASHNEGLRNARGDYLVVINDDITWDDPAWLSKLTFDGGIASCAVGEHAGRPLPNAWMFAMSRAWFERIGYFDGAYAQGINYEDTDYFFRAGELGAQFRDAGIAVRTRGEGTARAYLSEDEKHRRINVNRLIFQEKWGA